MLKTEMIRVPLRTGETSDPTEALVFLDNGLWVHRTKEVFGEDDYSWTITAGSSKKSLLSCIPSSALALQICAALVNYPGVDWTTLSQGDRELPSDLQEALIGLINLRYLLDSDLWEKAVKRLESLCGTSSAAKERR